MEKNLVEQMQECIKLLNSHLERTADQQAKIDELEERIDRITELGNEFGERYNSYIEFRKTNKITNDIDRANMPLSLLVQLNGHEATLAIQWRKMAKVPECQKFFLSILPKLKPFCKRLESIQ